MNLRDLRDLRQQHEEYLRFTRKEPHNRKAGGAAQMRAIRQRHNRRISNRRARDTARFWQSEKLEKQGRESGYAKRS